MSLDSIWFETLTAAERAELEAFSQAEIIPTPDVLIVGGGIVGVAAAYALSERGVQVELIEAGTLGGLASGANAGGIWPDQQGIDYPVCFRDLARRSRDLWGRLPAREGFDFNWRVNGFLTVDPMHWENSPDELVDQLLSEGLSAQAVDGDQARMLEPQLREGLVGGVHYPSEAQIHPVKAVLSFARVAQKNGATIVSGTRATSMNLNGAHVESVETTSGTIHPGRVISACGWIADWFADSLPSPPPLLPVSGQMIATAPQPPLLSGTVLGRAIIFQLKTGEVVTGGNVVEGELSAPDETVAAEFATAAAELVPALQGVPFLRAWTGVRPGTPDLLPIIDRLPGVENMWMAAGHFKNGVLLAPITAALLTEWLIDGKPSLDLNPFRWERF